MTEKNKAQWMPIGEAAKYIGVSRDTLRRWEKKGKIKTVRSPTNRRYYTKKQLDRIILGKNTQKTSKPRKKRLANPRQRLILWGILSFLIAVAFVLYFLQYQTIK